MTQSTARFQIPARKNSHDSRCACRNWGRSKGGCNELRATEKKSFAGSFGYLTVITPRKPRRLHENFSNSQSWLDMETRS